MHGLSTSISKQTNMKKTIIITLVAAALLGTQAFATEGTVLEGGYLINGTKYYGDGKDGSNVTISAGGEKDCSGITVYGSTSAFYCNNTITMTGGTVKEIIGAASSGSTLANNTIILAGGTVLEAVKFSVPNQDIATENNKIVLVGEGVHMATSKETASRWGTVLVFGILTETSITLSISTALGFLWVLVSGGGLKA